ncbi:MAG: hypothetical protein JO076_09575 [Verrucomicrobia bacterium]|nr:hypothetical protein [Verrucomicrobiota bacterium]
MPRGANPKREREYRELEQKFEQEGRYKGREKEVAARIVNKQRKQYSETKDEKAKDRAGDSPDDSLPIDQYDKMTAPRIRKTAEKLSDRDIDRLLDYEQKHKNRKSVVELLEKQRSKN